MDTRHEQPLTNDRLTVQKLKALGYTMGLIHAFSANRVRFAKFVWIIDNSASMTTADGHYIRKENKKIEFETCTRWKEMVDTVSSNIEVAQLIDTPTSYRLLNHPGPPIVTQSFNISSRESRVQGTTLEDEVYNALNIIKNIRPSGDTPLTRQVVAMKEEIEAMKRQNLLANGQKIAVVIATDGLPSSDEGWGETQQALDSFVTAVKSLKKSDVQIVVRLCTDEKRVVDFWNGLDDLIEAPLDVLDDYLSEAKEVYKCNPWLTYGLPIHRMREMGMDEQLFDKLDETAFDITKICEFLQILFKACEIPNPNTHDWKCFSKTIDLLLAREKLVFNPIHKTMTPWVDKNEIKKIFERRTGWKFRRW